MSDLDSLDTLFLAWAVLFEVVLIVHFILRKWAFDAYVMKYGWIVYALAVPAVIISVAILYGGKAWSFWFGGVIYFVWAVYGYVVEYVMHVQWRSPIEWQFLGPYVLLYLATVMFYWWPVALISRPLWYVCAGLFVASTLLNILSHRPARMTG
jgi:hypothetical protein